MITLHVLLVMAVSVLGNQDLDEVCPYARCSLINPPKYSDKPATKVRILNSEHSSDLEVLKVTPNLENLYAYDCSSDFKMDVFPSLAALKEIKIKNCLILELQNYQFENLINLDSLTLEGNSIEILSKETFHKLSRLRFLHLQNNLIKLIPEGIFSPLENLESLNLNNNNISILPKNTFLWNIQLKSIYLRGNPLKTVNLYFQIVNYANIAELDLRDCGELRDLRLSIGVSELYLQNCGVDRLQITGGIRYLDHKNSKVTRVDLSGTTFYRSFVQVLCDMPSLEWLDLSNSSKTFEYSVFDLDEDGKECKFPNLRSLNLSGNKFIYIPRRLPLFGPNLTTLDLSHNLLNDESLENLFYRDTSSKEEEGHFPNLMFLNIARNKLKNIPRNCHLLGPNLTVLDLSYNLLEDVSLESLAKARNLRSLSLEGNRLTSFDYLSICHKLKNLNRLALYDNMFNATFYRKMTKNLGDNGLQ